MMGLWVYWPMEIKPALTVRFQKKSEMAGDL